MGVMGVMGVGRTFCFGFCAGIIDFGGLEAMGFGDCVCVCAIASLDLSCSD